MLKEGAVRRFGQCMKFACWNGNFPYCWNDRLGRLDHENSPWILIFWKFRLSITLMYATYLTSRILLQLLLFKKENKKVSHLTIHFMWCTIYILCCLLHSNVILRRDETLNFVNQFLRFNARQLQKLYKTSAIPGPEKLRHEKNSKLLKSLLQLFGAISVAHTAICVLAFVVFAHKPYFVASMVLRHLWDHPIVIALFAVFEFSCYVHNWIIVLFHIFLQLSHLMSMRCWLSELKKKLANCRGVGVFGKARQTSLLLEYKRLLVLNHRFEEYCSIIWTGHKLIVIPLTVAGSYGAILLFRKVSLAIFFIYPSIFFVCFTFQIIFYRLSMELHRDAKVIHKVFLKRHGHGHGDGNGQGKLGMGAGEKVTKTFRPKFPKFVSSFSMFRQWSPPVFVQKLLFLAIKINFYLHSNIEIFRKSQEDQNIN